MIFNGASRTELCLAGSIEPVVALLQSERTPTLEGKDMFDVDTASSTPPFEQIKNQISHQRDTGELVAGFHLPPVRRLAADLGLAANTVARAYKELEAAGVIETRGRKGSFVTGTAESADKAAAHAAGEYAAVIRGLGIGDQRAIELVKSALASAGD